jgi:hypothetical protein
MSLAPDIQQSILNKNRKDKFLLVLNIPPILKTVNKASQSERSLNSFNLDSLQYSIYGTVVPEITIADIDIPYSTQTAKFTSYTRTAYKPITVNFTVDNQFNNWWVLWYWLNVINDSKEGTYNYNGLTSPEKFPNLNNYQTNITIYGLDEFNNKKIQWDYTKAFITSLGEIMYNYRDGDQIESSFTFAFNQLNSQLL